MKPSVIVFGGSGFIGQYLVNELILRGYSVTNADIKKELDHDHDYTFIQCDITDRKNISEIITKGAFDIVYNLAGFANLDLAIHHPYETINLNVLGNINILDACVEAKIKRFVFASSAYAMSNKGSFYGISKLASEKIVEEYQKRYNLDFTILRYGSMYSELPFDNNYIYSIVKEAVQTGEIRHNGDGQEIREYIHASDAAKLSVDVIESDDYVNLHIVLTGNEKLRRIELFELIREIMNEDLKILLVDKAVPHHYKYTPYSFYPSVSRKLGANPNIDMGQGILECIRSVHSRKKD